MRATRHVGRCPRRGRPAVPAAAAASAGVPLRTIDPPAVVTISTTRFAGNAVDASRCESADILAALAVFLTLT